MQKQIFNGRTVDSASEQWREQCEAQTVLNLPTRRERWDYIERVDKKRGQPASIRLQCVMALMMPTDRQRIGIIAALLEYKDADYRREFRATLEQIERATD